MWNGRTNWKAAHSTERKRLKHTGTGNGKVLDPSSVVEHVEMDENEHMVITILQTIRGLDGVIISQGLMRHVQTFEKGLVKPMRVLL